MRGIRKKLRKAWNVGGLSPKQRAGVGRAISAISRKGKTYSGDVTLGKTERVLLLRRKRTSHILDAIFPERNRTAAWLRLQDRDPSQELAIDLSRFSFLDDPRGAVAGLLRIAEAEASASTAKINFNDRYCLDVAPFMVLMECWGQMLPIFDGGRMDLPMQKVLAAVGIPQAMGIHVRGVRDFNDVWAFPLARRRGRGSTVSRSAFTDVQSREIAIDEFCDTLDAWLGEIDVALTDSGVGWIKNILGELLENAERHGDGGRMDGSWSVSGFMARRHDEGTDRWIFHVHLGILNVGDTFSVSLERALPEAREQLDRHVDKMQRLGARQSRETLRTLAALQDGVTCVAEADEAGRGGYGLQEMLALVCLLGHTPDAALKPRITIISGASCIRLRMPYLQGRRMGDLAGPRVLWCNPDNSTDSPPDEDYVFDLPRGLPGTAISIGFILDQEYYEQLRSGGTQNGDDRPERTDPGQGPEPDGT